LLLYIAHLDEGEEVGEELLEAVAERVLLRLEAVSVALVLEPNPGWRKQKKQKKKKKCEQSKKKLKGKLK